MNSREEGFLLLTGRLGNPKRRPLTVSQLRELERCVLRSEKPNQNRELTTQDLIGIGCSGETAERVVSLLDDRMDLHSYLEQGRAKECMPLSRVTPGYPAKVRRCLGEEAPGSIWYKGDLNLLANPMVALVGSRELSAQNAQFAKRVGQLAAQHGLTLISGNARGADTMAQESCLKAGGNVICVVADQLINKAKCKKILYLSEDGYDLPFSAQRALSRNRLIHCMAGATFVAQCSNGTGGTWDGTCRNLKGGWSPIYCLPDGTAGVAKLYQKGARLANLPDLDRIFAGIASELGNIDHDNHENDKMIK